MSFTDASGWAAWRDFTFRGIALPAGSQELRLVMDTGGFNLDYLDVAPAQPDNTPTPMPTPDPTPNPGQGRDKFGIKMLYPTKSGGLTWDSQHWDNGKRRNLEARAWDPYDPTGWSRHSGSQCITIDGNSVMSFNKSCSGGTDPRFYLDTLKDGKEFKNVEITAYHMRVQDANKFYAGFVFGTCTGPHSGCNATTYYGRIGNDGNSVFAKELDHPDSMARSSKPIWGGSPLPKNTWVGMKLVVYNLSNGDVKLELYMDETNGANGGNWKLINQYTDSGGWNPANSCPGRPKDYIITKGGMVFIYNTDVNDGRYKWMSVREIDP